MFVEKPLSVKAPEEVMELSQQLEKLQAEKGIIVAVGYMLRYNPAIEVSPTMTAQGSGAVGSCDGFYMPSTVLKPSLVSSSCASGCEQLGVLSEPAFPWCQHL